MPGFLVVLAGLALSSTAHAVEQGAGEPGLLDSRLADADTFGRYADHSKHLPASALSPGWQAGGGPSRRPSSARLAKPSLTAPSPRAEGPASPVILSASEAKTPRPGIPSIGWLALGAGAAGLGALLALSATAERPRKTRPRHTRAPKAPPLWDGPLTPILPWIEPEAAPLPPSRPIALLPSEPQVGARGPIALDPEPRWAASWKAVSAEEQQAIDAWDRSPEKRLGRASLEEWLDLRSGSLGAIDVALLKAKLRRDG